MFLHLNVAGDFFIFSKTEYLLGQDFFFLRTKGGNLTLNVPCTCGLGLDLLASNQGRKKKNKACQVRIPTSTQSAVKSAWLCTASTLNYCTPMNIQIQYQLVESITLIIHFVALGRNTYITQSQPTSLLAKQKTEMDKTMISSPLFSSNAQRWKMMQL